MNTLDKSFKDFVNNDFLRWLKDNSLQYKDVNPHLYIIYRDEYCIKIYDKAGHGYSFTANLARSFSENMYQDDEITFYWVHKFFGLSESYTFSKRSQDGYLKNIPIFIQDLKALVPHLNQIKSSFWEDIKSFISDNIGAELKNKKA